MQDLHVRRRAAAGRPDREAAIPARQPVGAGDAAFATRSAPRRMQAPHHLAVADGEPTPTSRFAA
jgi:hypothetical protein